MRRAPARPVRACILRKWCPVSHVTFEAPLRTSHFSLQSSHSTLHTSHWSLRTPHFTSHCTLKTPHFTLHTSQSALQTSHFIAGCNHFTRKNARFRAPASSPKQSPGNIHAAITIRFAASRSKPASLYTHGNTRWQQSCSHSNAICNHRFKKRIELRT